MAGFVWTPRQISPEHRRVPGDLWCLRDAFCELFGWPEGSDDWRAFIEAPQADDVPRLIEFLGLKEYDPEYPLDARFLSALLDHPGIAFYEIPSLNIGHCIFEPHLRYMRGLDAAYRAYQPELFRVVPDSNQPPRNAASV
jgi:hypothetical protein